MRIFAISDLHISRTSDKPMEVFGGNWVGYLDKIKADWTKKAAEGDVVLIPGDISWAMDLKEALFDMEEFSALPGEKILVRGNHDYWWKSISRIRESLPPHVYALQNDAVRLGNVGVERSRHARLFGDGRKTVQTRGGALPPLSSCRRADEKGGGQAGGSHPLSAL